MDKDFVLRQILEVDSKPRCADWGSKVQYICEFFWSALENTALIDSAVSPTTVTAFAKLLQDDEAFALAQHMIPALRESETLSDLEMPPYRAQILRTTSAMRQKAYRSREVVQASFDSAAYQKEKEIFQEVEAYRVRLYLGRSEQFTAEEEREVNAWLAQCPVALRRPPR